MLLEKLQQFVAHYYSTLKNVLPKFKQLKINAETLRLRLSVFIALLAAVFKTLPVDRGLSFFEGLFDNLLFILNRNSYVQSAYLYMPCECNRYFKQKHFLVN